MYIYIYVIYVYLYIYMYDTCLFTYIYTCIYIYVFEYVCICICIYIYVCIYVSLYIHICIYVYTYIYIYAYKYINIYIYTHIQIHVYNHMYTSHVYLYMYKCILLHRFNILFTSRTRYKFSISLTVRAYSTYSLWTSVSTHIVTRKYIYVYHHTCIPTFNISPPFARMMVIRIRARPITWRQIAPRQTRQRKTAMIQNSRGANTQRFGLLRLRKCERSSGESWVRLLCVGGATWVFGVSHIEDHAWFPAVGWEGEREREGGSVRE